ncbi:MAG: PDGLE domain-containing protein [Actinomycetia bacterium]|nr:PDGLE domain-containing protein [Actinomycetes bacterium]MCH9762284.1 PDGLE domain-containing protein [Actinomycetes bacterium]
MTRRWTFWVVSAVTTLLIAGVVSYFAASSPDGLDSTTLRGCEVVETAAGEQLTGECIAQRSAEHHLAESPLAGYAVGGRESAGGLAGVIGVLVTVAVAGGGFWLIARSRSDRR